MALINVEAYWIDVNFSELKKGHIFRLFDTDKDGNEKPDVLTEDGSHQICVALSDAQPTGDEFENYAVQTIPIRGT